MFSWLLSAEFHVKEHRDGDNRQQNDGADKTYRMRTVKSDWVLFENIPGRTTGYSSNVHSTV